MRAGLRREVAIGGRPTDIRTSPAYLPREEAMKNPPKSLERKSFKQLEQMEHRAEKRGYRKTRDAGNQAESKKLKLRDR